MADEKASTSKTVTRRTMVAAALGTSALAFAASRGLGDGSTAGKVVVGPEASEPVANAVTTPPGASDYTVLIQRHRNMLTGGGGFDPGLAPYAGFVTALDSQVAGFLSTLNTAAGRTYLWNDAASSTGSANMTASFSRLRTMSLQYATSGSSYAGNTSLRNTIVSALQFMLDNRYPAGSRPGGGNWWDWEIGSPMALLDSIVLLGSAIPVALKDGLLAAVAYQMEPASAATAANQTWYTRVALIYSIVAGDATIFDQAHSSLLQLMAYTPSGDGFHADGSFIQHEDKAYTGGYGVEMMFQLSWMVYLLGGPTSTWLAPADWSIMVDWVWKSYEPLLYRGALTSPVLGRNIARTYYSDHYSGSVFLSAILLMSAVASSGDAANLKALFKTQVIADTARNYFAFSTTSGMGNQTLYLVSLGWATRNDSGVGVRDEPNKTVIYAQMDRFAHRKPGWSFIVAGYSSRISAYESGHSENLHGWYTGTGTTYFYNQYDLEHYQDDFWPTVDPYRMPGTTIDKRSRGNGALQGPSLTPTTGGVSDQNCGVAVQTIERDSSSHKARKSWIFIGDYIVCQGSGITNTSANAVETIIENRNIGASGTNGVQMNSSSTNVMTVMDATQTLGANWLHVDGVGGYLFPGSNPTIRGMRNTRSGRWSDISAQVKTPTDLRTRRYLTMWFDHGVNPANDSYGYIFIPNATLTETGGAWGNNLVRRQTTTNAHYAYANFSTIDVYGAMFWGAGAIGIFSASAMAAVIVRVTNERISITISDPDQTQTAPITVRVNLPNSSVYSTQSSVTVSRTASYADITFSPAGMKGGGGRAVLNI